MKRVQVLVAMASALCLALILPLTALAAGSQIWYLGSTVTPAGSQMVKGDSSQTGSVAVPNASSVVWISDQQSQGVTFASGTWFADIATDGEWGVLGTDCIVKIGRWNPNTTLFQEFSLTQPYEGQWSLDGTTHILKVDVQMASEVVNSGDYLALKITNQSGASRLVLTGQGSQASCLKSPQTDPGYPLPEVAAGILLGAGLAGLAGFMLVKRKKAARNEAAG